MGQSYSDEEESYDDSDGDGASPRGTTTSAPPPTSLKIETAAPPPAAVRVVSERRRSSVSVEAERKKARREEFLCELAALAAVDTASLDADGSTALDARISRADAFLDEREKIATADLTLARAKATRAAAEIAKLKAELDMVVGEENGVLEYVLALRCEVTNAEDVCRSLMHENDDLLESIEDGEHRIKSLLEPPRAKTRPVQFHGRSRAPGNVSVGTSVNPFETAMSFYDLPM